MLATRMGSTSCNKVAIHHPAIMWPRNIPKAVLTVPERFVCVGQRLALPSNMLEQHKTRLMNIFLTTQKRLSVAEGTMGGITCS